MSSKRITLLRRLAGGAAALAAAIGGVAAAPSAGAFPGHNGKIAFISWREGLADIWVMNPDGSKPTNLTKTPEATEFQPAFSPDGKRIAFNSDRDGRSHGLFVMNADGSNPKRITDFGGWPTWSPDGKRIAFSAHDIWTVDADGTNLSQLTPDPAVDAHPSWSPDGSRIAFDRAGRIWTIDADGTDPVDLASGITPAWSPDGKRIAFTGGPDIHVMNSDGTNPVVLAKPGAERFPTWSPDGKRLAFETLPPDGESLDYEVWVMGSDGSNPINITNNNLPGSRAIDASADWGRTPALPLAAQPPIEPGSPPASTPPPWSAAAPRR